MRRLLIICVLIPYMQNSFSQSVIYPTGLTITGYEGPIEEGSTLQLQAIPTPSNTTYDAYSWSSKNTSVATVDDNGLVTAIGEGTATITCLLSMIFPNPGYFAVPNEQTATCTITVKKKASNVINFVDAEVKRICVKNWDTDGDQELSYTEAAAVTDIGEEFYGNNSITSFDELAYFTSITSIGEEAFRSCANLTSITIPQNVTSIGRCPFSECTSLTTIVVDNRNTKFDSREGCNAIIETTSNTLVTGCDYTTIPISVTSIGEEAFRNCVGMTSINIPNSVTSIGEYAFGNCTSLTSVTIPNSLTSISLCAFYYCTSLTSVTIPNSVTSIGYAAFWNCSSLASITIPNSVNSIVSRAFEDCMNLTNVTVEIRNPLSIDSYTFPNRANATLYVPYGCRLAYLAANYWKEFKEIRELEPQPSDIIRFASSEVKRLCVENWDTNGDGELSFEEAAAVTDLGNVFNENRTITSFKEFAFFTGITSIGDETFFNCVNMVSVTIPKNVTSIGEYAFAYCTSLTSITIPNSVTSVSLCAFYYCSGLTSVTMSNSLALTNSSVFEGCTNLASVSIPNSVTTIYSGAFKDCTSLTSVTIPNSVTTIYNHVFSGCTKLTTVVIPSSVTTIYQYAFKDCSGLTSVDLSTNLSSIAEGVFNGCIGLTSITIPNSVKTIDDYAFSKCSGLTSVSISNKVTSIGVGAFSGCSSLAAVTIPDRVKSIAKSAFMSCSSLTAVTIPQSVNSIGENVFEGCTSLETIIVESGNTKYDSRDNCNAIIETASNTLVIACNNSFIPNTVTALGTYAFNGCSGILSLTIPSSVTSIPIWGDLNGTTTFLGCTNIESIVVESENTKYDSRGNCNAIIRTATNTLLLGCKNTVIPNTVSTIASYAFQRCSGLTSITIPNSVTSIGYYAFQKCTNLTSVTIPSSVTSINESAFDGCTNLTSIVVGISTPISIKSNVFTNRANATLYVPKGSRDAYLAADYWKEFKEIIERDLNIEFADAEVKRICVENWDTDGDGELSFEEAAAVTDLQRKFSSNTVITQFNELQYFTGLTLMYNEFSHCDALQSVVIPENVVMVGANAFSWCKNLTQVELPEGLDMLGDFAFIGCEKLPRITIPNSVKTIYNWTFQNCNSFTSIEIPENVNYIGNNIISSCEKLTTVTVNANNKYFDSRDNCNAIIETNTNALIAACQTTKIPNSIKALGDYAFNFCKGLTSIEIPNSVESIGYGAFNGDSLTSIRIPANVSFVGIRVFGYCDKLSSIEVDADNTHYDSRDNCNAIIHTATNTLIAGSINTVIPESVTSIADYAFYVYNSLKDVVLPPNITSIGNGAFEAASLNSVTAKMKIPAEIASESTFSGRRQTILYVPKGSRDAYIAADYWKDFKEIVEKEDHMLGDVNGNDEIDIGDAVSIVNHLMGKEVSTFIEEAADTNKNGQIDIGDVVTIINYLIGMVESLSR